MKANNIRPVSDLRNKFTEIHRICEETGEPLFFTKNGKGNLVVMSSDTYDRKQQENEIYLAVKEAELLNKYGQKKKSFKEFDKEMKKMMEE